jgi:hypothetical protein
MTACGQRGQSTGRMAFLSAAVPAPAPPSALIWSRTCQSFAASSRASAASAAGPAASSAAR